MSNCFLKCKWNSSGLYIIPLILDITKILDNIYILRYIFYYSFRAIVYTRNCTFLQKWSSYISVFILSKTDRSCLEKNSQFVAENYPPPRWISFLMLYQFACMVYKIPFHCNGLILTWNTKNGSNRGTCLNSNLQYKDQFHSKFMFNTQERCLILFFGLKGETNGNLKRLYWEMQSRSQSQHSLLITRIKMYKNWNNAPMVMRIRKI